MKKINKTQKDSKLYDIKQSLTIFFTSFTGKTIITTVIVTSIILAFVLPTMMSESNKPPGMVNGYTRDASSGTGAEFKRAIGMSETDPATNKYTKQVYEVRGNDDMNSRVATIDGSLGYVSISSINT
jgi:hypothetical protein